MNIRNIHYFSGITISVFIALHLFNHMMGISSIQQHIEVMKHLRLFYRNIFAETMLMVAVMVQFSSGLQLFFLKRKSVHNFFEKLQLYSGLYMAFFLLVHLSAVFSGRFLLHLDTNFYFGAAGINTFPLNLFFVSYYLLAIFSFFGHIAAIHYSKMNRTISGLSVKTQAYLILGIGFFISLCTFYGMTRGFQGIEIPEEYRVLIGK